MRFQLWIAAVVLVTLPLAACESSPAPEPTVVEQPQSVEDSLSDLPAFDCARCRKAHADYCTVADQNPIWVIGDTRRRRNIEQRCIRDQDGQTCGLSWSYDLFEVSRLRMLRGEISISDLGTNYASVRTQWGMGLYQEPLEEGQYLLIGGVRGASGLRREEVGRTISVALACPMGAVELVN